MFDPLGENLPDVGKKEKILLDARLEEMISITAFRATLQNGHRLVAYIPRKQQENGNLHLNIGDIVNVCMSPFDMNRGRVVIGQGN